MAWPDRLFQRLCASSNDGEERVAAQAAERVAGVLEQALDPPRAPYSAGIFGDAQRVAEFAKGSGAGFRGRHAAFDVFAGFHLDVFADITVEVVFHAAT